MRVGIDLVSVSTVRDSIRTDGEHYLKRLAARFAAKETTLKVLRPDDQSIPWNTIEVQRYPAGWVALKLSGQVRLSRIIAVIRQAPFSLFRRAIARRHIRPGSNNQLDQALDRLRDTNKYLLLVFSENEPLHEELQRQGRVFPDERWPNLELDLITGRDHTLRPLYSQQHAHEVLDRALDRLMAQSPQA